MYNKKNLPSLILLHDLQYRLGYKYTRICTLDDYASIVLVIFILLNPSAFVLRPFFMRRAHASGYSAFAHGSNSSLS